jgi:glutaredoxin-like protein
VSLISEQDREYLKTEFSKNLKREVQVLYFADQENESDYAMQTKELLEELVSLNDNLSLVIKNCGDEKSMKSENLTLCPSIKVKSERNGFMNFYGVPAGYEFTSFIEAINDMGGDNLSLSEDIIEDLKQIDQPVDIKVFITHGCPYCPGAVRNAHTFSLVNDNIKSSMVDANYFDEISRKNQVSSVPHIVINDKVSFTGNMPPRKFLDKIKEALNK